MSEEQDNPVEVEELPDSGEPVGGERLARARREQQISVLEIAKELHIDEAKVRALERNEFAVLGAAVFAKGHLRKYAELVGVNQDDVLTDYYKMTHTMELPPVVVKRRQVRRELSPGPWIAAIILFLAAAVAYWWFVVRPSESTAVPTPVNAPATSAQPQPQPEPAAAGSDAGTAAGEEQPQQASPVANEARETARPEPPADGILQLSLKYSGDCWTEITDASGKRLLFEMGHAGRTANLEGAAPVDVLFGNVENVSVTVNGEAYPVRPNTPGSRTARLTIVEP